jgi:phycocyanobilin:ferredoxin oxidoreductase
MEDNTSLAPPRQIREDARPSMARAAAQFQARLLAEQSIRRLPVPELGAGRHDLDWNNTLLESATFRRAHVETFVVPGRLSVLHVCVFPHLHDPAPIFGFDMVAGPARVTGIFVDLSPVIAQPAGPGLREAVGHSALEAFAVRRELPEWAEIFSPDLLAIRPTDEAEIERAIALGFRALEAMLSACGRRRDTAETVAEGQARYALGQRRNEHTWRMLASFIGATPARQFIDEILFPLPVA